MKKGSKMLPFFDAKERNNVILCCSDEIGTLYFDEISKKGLIKKHGIRTFEIVASDLFYLQVQIDKIPTHRKT